MHRVPGTAANRESVLRLRGAATSGHTAQSDGKKRQASKQEDVLNSFLELSRGPEERLPRQSPLLTSTFRSDSRVELGYQPSPSCPHLWSDLSLGLCLHAECGRVKIQLSGLFPGVP